MHSEDKLIAVVVAVFGFVIAVGAIASAIKGEEKSTTLDVEPGIECEMTLGKGDEPNVIKCQLEERAHGGGIAAARGAK